MIRPRLSRQEIVTSARLLPLWDVMVGDCRLTHLEEWTCRCAAMGIPDFASFVLWPDMALGFVIFARDASTRADRLIEAYRPARESLELLALDFFYLFDRSRPQ